MGAVATSANPCLCICSPRANLPSKVIMHELSPLEDQAAVFFLYFHNDLEFVSLAVSASSLHLDTLAILLHTRRFYTIMDPASAVGVASAVLAIVNIIARNMISLSDLQLKYNTADLKVGLLIGQLSTVKAALNQIAGLFENDNRTLRDPSLVQDFSTSLGCVEAVVVVLDNKISLVQRNAADELTTRSKINFLWDEKTMDDYLNLLNNQIQALGLLLTAFQWFV